MGLLTSLGELVNDPRTDLSLSVDEANEVSVGHLALL
jgi:hypothetical protein